MQHQSFSDVNSNSASLQKLTALRLPSLTGKRFLDIGCREGFFCGYALFEGASHVVGIDPSLVCISSASAQFSDAEFINGSWDTLPEGPFDVITVLSSLNEAEDQEATIHQLMNMLADNGLLIIETGIATGSQTKRTKELGFTDEVCLPTRSDLRRILKEYAWKIIYEYRVESENQHCIVLHIRKLQPYAFLLIKNPGMGKSTISRRLFGENSDIPVISGDRVYREITEGKYKVSKKLRNQVSEDFSVSTVDKTTHKVFEQGLANELIQLWIRKVGFKDFALDSYIPKEYRPQIKNILREKGYFPVDFSWDNPTPLTKAKIATSKANQYDAYLKMQRLTLTNEHFKITNKLIKNYKPLIQWHLDSPSKNETYSGADNIRITGWAITKEHLQSSYTLYATSSENEASFPPVKVREDVLDSVFGSADVAPIFWQTHPCGFTFELPASWLKSGIELGLVIDKVRIPLARITIAPTKSTSLTKQLVSRLKRLGKQA